MARLSGLSVGVRPCAWVCIRAGVRTHSSTCVCVCAHVCGHVHGSPPLCEPGVRQCISPSQMGTRGCQWTCPFCLVNVDLMGRNICEGRLGLISHSVGVMGARGGLMGQGEQVPEAPGLGRPGGAGGFPGAQISALQSIKGRLVWWQPRVPLALRVCDSKLLKWGHWPGDLTPAEEGASSKSCLAALALGWLYQSLSVTCFAVPGPHQPGAVWTLSVPC